MIVPFVVFTLLALLIGWLWRSYRSTTVEWKTNENPFPQHWRDLLTEHVDYYRGLNAEEKRNFESKIHEFLASIAIKGIETEVTELDHLFVASSAIIPIFGFKNWRYPNLREVLIYPDRFNSDYQFKNAEDNTILGMVGSHQLEGVVILSQKALRYGFNNEKDKKNTAIHEFVHLVDKADGHIDGVPQLFLDKEHFQPWMQHIHNEIQRILNDQSDINPYGATNNAEFFAVISEYFFERPDLLEKKYPELYLLLEKIFRQDMEEHYNDMNKQNP